MAERLPLTLHAYRGLTAMAVPAVDALLRRRLQQGKEDGARLTERRGQAAVARPDGPVVWLHSASVGELTSVLPLIERIRTRDLTVLVTSGTVTSAALAGQRLPSGVIHQFVPVDTPQFVKRFLDHWRPDLALFVEADLWPNLIMESSRRKVPLILVNGRVSERSYRRWRMAPTVIGALLRRFDLCLAQSADDAARYAGLGAPRYLTTGNLKLDVPPPPADADKLRALQDALGMRLVIAATSTHAGEEEGVIEAHRRLMHSFPGLLTMLVPRHPERGPVIADLARGAGLRVAVRSQGELPDGSTEIYVADTLGELGLVYRVASVVFMGGSLVRHGGQNPIEAAKLGAPILHGPHVWNFAEIYSKLDSFGGAELVTDTGRLTVRIGAWLTDPEARYTVAQAGLAAMATLSGALERTMIALEPYLMQFRLEQRGDA